MTTALMLALVAATSQPDFPWAGQGQARVMVSVAKDASADPAANNTRADERPADVRINFADLLRERGITTQLPDIASIQVIRQDATTGQPLHQGKFAFGRGEYEIPSRWYDAAIPYDFPECEANVATTGGKLPVVERKRTGYFYECIGDARDGRLAFVHRDDTPVAWYGVYFDLMVADKIPDRSPPRGFLGDGLHRCEPLGHSTTGLIHSRVDVCDVNDDALPDLVIGCGRGSIVWYPNVGTPTTWKFVCSRLLATRDGQPIDVGYSAAPHLVDFDGDGRRDLLVGAERNRVVWYRNVGKNAAPQWEYAGLIEADGKPLELPVTPVPEGPDVYTLDYYPLLESADWDGDGDTDLLAGGYVTGRIYWYENTAEPRSPMRLHFAGALNADGKPIDVGWAAAPAVGDLDGDGDLDLVTGCMPMTAGGGDSVSSEKFLLYFENVGNRTAPQLRAKPLPHRGKFPTAAIASPRLVDFNGDQLLDIVASSGEEVYLFANIGTRDRPEFQAHADHVPGVWSSATLAGTQFFDYDGDGQVDAADGPRIYRNTGRGSPGVFASPQSLLKPGQQINHLSGIGDDWTFPRLYDLDTDGIFDLLDADHGGHIWWHRNRGSAKECDFETAGVRLSLTDGTPLVVGGARTGFEALQGARATYTAGDFDRDGRADLVTADNTGEVLYFRQTAGQAGTPSFEPGRRIAKLRIRAVPTACDWDGDGRLDVVVGSSADDVTVIAGADGREGATFESPRPIPLPPAPDGAGAPLVVTDYNGDGDLDIILHTAYAYTCFYERSFIDKGYAQGEVARFELRPTSPNND